MSKMYLPVAGAALLLLSCGNNKKGTPNPADAAKDYAVISLAPIKATIHYDFPATIQGQQVIEIRPKVDGYVKEIYVNEGANVKKGQLLFTISNPEYEQAVITARASIKSAVADVNAAQMDVNKVRPLVEKDIVSKYQLESAQYTLQSKQASLAQAQATLANAETNVGYTIIKAPADGVIGTIPYKIGALVSSTSTEALTTLSNISNVYAYFSLNEKQLLDFSEMVPGNTLEEKVKQLPAVTLVLANGSEYSLKGKVETASGLIATTTGTVQFKATFPNPLGIIKSGASAILRIPRSEDSALVIPQGATYELQDKRFTYIVTKDNYAISKPITTTANDNGQFFIVKSGLKAGDQIVIEGASNLRDSTLIKPRIVNADSLYQKID
ncbi:efflux RND transporter periplasmic adaptor subunit [Chitinophaga sancti]|uniref:efflux RND transporter periplasmic adaptor subunit n=1 Tax=Chitinophaga sancti TaxID=1004 RepID=UPI002A758438|nr:efflux RND transporter periplasmic adaptor subunit [Chitinophaga sancti]WPQ65219.1 efflux RND transporter periplasmic adaptor subunit [Chitinophaga sancti]